MARYGTIVTKKGKEKVARAILENSRINITHFAAGDGGGNYYQPSEEQNALRNERWRGNVNVCRVSAQSPNMIEIIAVVPPEEGGFTIREIAAFDESGDMIVIANTPDTEKVVISSGAAGEIKLTIYMEISNAEVVQLKIDPFTVTATKKDLQEHNEDPNAHGGSFNAKEVIDEHIANQDLHLTREQKQNYNEAIVEIQRHIENEGIHVTETKKQKWDEAGEKATQNEEELREKQAKITELEGKIRTLEGALFNNITGNPYTVTFQNLDGVAFSHGNHNKSKSRVEC